MAWSTACLSTTIWHNTIQAYLIAAILILDSYMDIQQAILLAIHRKFEAEGVVFAYPTQTLVMERHRGERSPAVEAANRETSATDDAQQAAN